MKVTPIIDIGKKIYHKIPASLRWFLLPVRLLFRLIDISKLDLWILNGEEISSHQELSIIYAGTEINRNYFAKLAYDNSFSETYLGKVWIWGIPNAVREKGHACSLLVIAVHKLLWRFFARRAYFSIPFWVSSSANIAFASSLLTKSKSVRNDIRKIRNGKLSLEVTRDHSQFDNFYYNMYRPYIDAAHGDRAIIVEYDYMKKEFKNSELLLIKKEGEYIAGTLLVYRKRRSYPAYFGVFGVKDGNFDYVQDGAIAAIFVFSIRLFREKGYEGLGLGLSRPFLKDGVLRYKKKWGGRQISCSPQVDGAYYVEPLTDTPGLKAFLINNPFIFIDKRKINGAIFVNSDHSVSQESLEKIYRHYYFNGMSKLFIYQFGENSYRTQKILPLQYSDRIRLCPAETLFQKHR
jgi:hypothetical protein